MSPSPPPSDAVERLLAIMARLRNPDYGCPWDVQQTFATIAPYTVEEAYEVADAVQRNDLGDLKDELGDLLLQVVFHARMAEEIGAFAFEDVANAICDKMIRRHPHVFGTEARKDAGTLPASWEAIKAEERSRKSVGHAGALADVPLALPGLLRAVKLTKRAARVGFDWPRVADVIVKLREELAELEVEIAAGDQAKARDELGDLLFVCANLARKLEADPEDALRAANAKFTRRFGYVESVLARSGRSPEQSSLEEMDAIWNEIRATDKAPPGVG